MRPNADGLRPFRPHRYWLMATLVGRHRRPWIYGKEGSSAAGRPVMLPGAAPVPGLGGKGVPCAGVSPDANWWRGRCPCSACWEHWPQVQPRRKCGFKRSASQDARLGRCRPVASRCWVCRPLAKPAMAAQARKRSAKNRRSRKAPVGCRRGERDTGSPTTGAQAPGGRGQQVLPGPARRRSRAAPRWHQL